MMSGLGGVGGEFAEERLSETGSIPGSMSSSCEGSLTSLPMSLRQSSSSRSMSGSRLSGLLLEGDMLSSLLDDVILLELCCCCSLERQRGGREREKRLIEECKLFLLLGSEK